MVSQDSTPNPPLAVVGVLQARSSSRRLPGKVLQPINGRPMIEHQIARIRRSQLIEELVVATSTDPSDDGLAQLCASLNVPVIRGPLDDVLGRFHLVMQKYPSSHVVRLTADCPLTSPTIIDEVIRLHLTSKADYTSNCHPPTYPDGLDVEVVRSEALEWAHENAKPGPEREHVTLAVAHAKDRFQLKNLAYVNDLAEHRWTVDVPEDLDFVRDVYALLEPLTPDFDMADVLDAIDAGLLIKHSDSATARNESLTKQLKDNSHE